MVLKKHYLLLLPLVLLTSYILYILQNSSDGKVAMKPAMSGKEASSYVIDGKFQGEDKEGQPFDIWAKRAWRESEELARLEGIRLETKNDQGNIFQVLADIGDYLANDKMFLAHEGVSLLSDDGLQANSYDVVYDLENMLIIGSYPVEGKGGFGEFAADSFQYDVHNRVLQLKNNVRIIYWRD